jgi:hypothetical protein
MFELTITRIAKQPPQAICDASQVAATASLDSLPQLVKEKGCSAARAECYRFNAGVKNLVLRDILKLSQVPSASRPQFVEFSTTLNLLSHAPAVNVATVFSRQ